jgi:LysR family glycine cleavage system transcriptional activator
MREKKSPLERPDLPPLNAIRAFEAAARRGSFSLAAAELNVTHWAVGKQIRLLEDWFGLPLFERQHRKVTLTDEGAELLADVSSALSRLANAAAKFGRPGTPRRVSGTVRVNVPTSFALRWLIPRMLHFQTKFPHIDIRISTTSRKLRYVGSAFDFGVRLNRQPGTHLKFRTLMKDWQLPACNPEILRTKPIRTTEDLRQHTLLHSATTRPAWPQWLSAAGHPHLTPTRHLELDHVHLQLQAAVDGLGVAIASLPLIARDVAAGRLVCPIAKPEFCAGDYLLVSEDRSESAAAGAFRTWIMAAAKGASTD